MEYAAPLCDLLVKSVLLWSTIIQPKYSFQYLKPLPFDGGNRTFDAFNSFPQSHFLSFAVETFIYINSIQLRLRLYMWHTADSDPLVQLKPPMLTTLGFIHRWPTYTNNLTLWQLQCSSTGTNIQFSVPSVGSRVGKQILYITMAMNTDSLSTIISRHNKIPI